MIIPSTGYRGSNLLDFLVMSKQNEKALNLNEVQGFNLLTLEAFY